MPDRARPAFFWLRDGYQTQEPIAKMHEECSAKDRRMVNRGIGIKVTEHEKSTLNRSSKCF
jgi:hypothetical protein